jgi:hypothetical protein
MNLLEVCGQTAAPIITPTKHTIILTKNTFMRIERMIMRKTEFVVDFWIRSGQVKPCYYASSGRSRDKIASQKTANDADNINK